MVMDFSCLCFCGGDHVVYAVPPCRFRSVYTSVLHLVNSFDIFFFSFCIDQLFKEKCNI